MYQKLDCIKAKPKTVRVSKSQIWISLWNSRKIKNFKEHRKDFEETKQIM